MSNGPGALACPPAGSSVACGSKIPAVASAEAKNLEAIAKAIDQHNRNCPYPAAEVRMNPFEVERLGWDEIRGLPVVPDAEIGTGRFRIVCSRELDDEGLEEVETVGQELQTIAPVNN
jgi:hypothetical protein